MTVETLWEMARYANVLLSVFVLVAIIIRWQSWAVQPNYVRLIGLGLAMLVFATGYGTVETLIHDVPPGLRVLFYNIALVWLSVAMVLPRTQGPLYRRPV